MSRLLIILSLAGFSLLPSSQGLAADKTLTFNQAVAMAISRTDPSVMQYSARAEAVRASAIADAQLPDPKIKFGVANIATDSFRLNQEAMTQLQFGVHQSFPSAAKRRLLKERGDAGGEVFQLMAAKRERVIAREVGRVWLKLKYIEMVSAIVLEKKARLLELLEALGAKYESGGVDAQKILAMEAELALLDDKLEVLDQDAGKERINLARYIGDEEAGARITGDYGDIAMPPALSTLEEALMDHPDLLQEKAVIHASDKSEQLARENYKPNWGLDLGYGYRAGGRSDMATAMVTFDVPLFTGKRQDKRLFAAKKSKQAARFNMRAKELDMVKNIRAAYVVWQKSAKRISLYNTVVLERTKSARIASENAYASGSADFAEIIRTHLSELDARLNLQAIRLDRAMAQVELQYYRGDQP